MFVNNSFSNPYSTIFPHHITNVVPLPPHPPPPYYKKYRKGTRNKCTAKFKEKEILEK